MFLLFFAEDVKALLKPRAILLDMRVRLGVPLPDVFPLSTGRFRLDDDDCDESKDSEDSEDSCLDDEGELDLLCPDATSLLADE